MLAKILKHQEKIVWALLVLIATPYIVYLVPQYLGVDAYIVDSGSMEPTIPEGSVVYEKWNNPETLEEDDIIIFRPNSSEINEDIVVHRIIERREENYTPEFRTKGDANQESDPGWTPGYRVVGQQMFHVPYIGYFISATNSLFFVLALMFVPASILIYQQITKILENMEDTEKSNPGRTPLYQRKEE
jgi:signal peptidase